MAVEPGTPEYIPDMDAKKFNFSSTMEIEGKNNYNILSAIKDDRRCLLYYQLNFDSIFYSTLNDNLRVP